jgi:hypothetical protein
MAATISTATPVWLMGSFRSDQRYLSYQLVQTFATVLG